MLALQQILGLCYAQPITSDEIGFGGPAYPRGYCALNHGAPETDTTYRSTPTATRTTSSSLVREQPAA
jgi:hypothetical protein